MSKLAKLTILGLMLCLTTGVNLGCNTTEGAGRDVERAGEGVQDMAN